MKGAKFLKVISIIMVVLSVFAILGGILAMMLPSTAALSGYVLTVPENIYYLSAVLTLVDGVVYLITSIFGIIAPKNPSKAKICVILGTVLLILIIVSNIFTIVVSSSSILLVIISILIPALYLYAAITLKKSADAANKGNVTGNN